MQAADHCEHGADRAATHCAASGHRERQQITLQLSQAAAADAYLGQRRERRQLRQQLACFQHAGRDQASYPPQMPRYGALAGAADHRVGLLIGQPHAAAGITFHQLLQLHYQVQPDVAFRDHEPRQHALGVLFALPFRLRTDQRHDHQFVVAPVRTAHQPLAPGMDARLMPPPTQQARPLSRGFGHRRQICLNFETCEFRMCQFSWWGSPRTG